MSEHELGGGYARVTRREFVLGGLMAAASGVAYLRMPVPNHPPLKTGTIDAMLPDAVGKWRVSASSNVILPPPDALRDRLYDNLVTRTYVNDTGRVLMLVLAYNNVQDGVIQVHRPEFCYQASGFTLRDPQQTVLRLGSSDVPANAFTGDRRDRREQVLYFTRLGSGFPLSWAAQRLTVFEANMQGNIPDGLLVRASLAQPEPGAGMELLSNFLEELVSEGNDEFRLLMTGNRGAGKPE